MIPEFLKRTEWYTVNGNGGSDGYDDYEKIAKAVAERLAADMGREADACGQTDVPASLDRRMEAMFALRRRKAEVRHRIFSAVAAAAVVLLVSVCCLRQSMSPGDAGWSYEIGRKFHDSDKVTGSTDDLTEADAETKVGTDRGGLFRLLL